MNSHVWLVLSLLPGIGALRFVVKNQVGRMVTLIRVTTTAIGATFGGRPILIARSSPHCFWIFEFRRIDDYCSVVSLHMREKLVGSAGPRAGFSGSMLGGRV